MISRNSIIVLVALYLFAGCTDSGKPDGLVPAKGVVTFKGAPVGGATVMFGGRETIAVGKTDDSGAFVLSTRGTAGALPGNYKVSVAKRSAGGEVAAVPPSGVVSAEETAGVAEAVNESELPVRYSDISTSGLEIEIKLSGPNEFKIDLAE